MSLKQHPVGYRPQGDPKSEPRRRVGCKRRALLLVLVTLAGLGVVVLRTLAPGDLTDWVRQLDQWLEGHADEPSASARVERETDDSGSTETSEEAVWKGFIERKVREHMEAGDAASAMRLAAANSPAMVRQLLEEHGVDPNLRLTFGGRDSYSLPLIETAERGSTESVSLLLEFGAEVDATDSQDRTALQLAASKGHLDVVERLLAAGADVNHLATTAIYDNPRFDLEPPVGATAIGAAARAGHLDVVHRLLQAEAQPRYLLHGAAASGSVELIDLALGLGSDPNEHYLGEGPIRSAVLEGETDAVRYLLELGSQPGDLALREAAGRGHDDILRLFADHGVRFDGPPSVLSPLRSAARNGHASTVRLLLELGASPEAAPGVESPLELAREQGHDEVVAILEGR